MRIDYPLTTPIETNRPSPGLPESNSPRSLVKRAKKLTFILLANVLLAFFVVCLGEIYLRKSLKMEPYSRTSPGQFENESAASWANADPTLGWTSAVDHLPGEINALGFRDTKDFKSVDPSPGTKRVMILGDSFIFGAHLTSGQTIPALIQTKLDAAQENRHEVFNLGIPGWGIDQMYVAYQHYKGTINPDVVILAYIDDDVKRSLESFRRWEKLNKPSFTIKGGQLSLRTAASANRSYFEKLTERSVVSSFMARELYLMTEIRSTIHLIFLAISRDMQRQGKTFVVVRIQTQDNFLLRKKIRRRLNGFADIVAKEGALFLEPAEEMTQIPRWQTALYTDDGHLNALGSQLMANYIFEHVFADGS